MLKKKIKLRLYQEEILNDSKNQNTLIVLPTGLGKTIIAIAHAYLTLKKNPNKKIIVLAPSKPLIKQHQKKFEEYLNTTTTIISGETPPQKRTQLYKENQILFCTPQTIRNDILTNKITPNQISLIIYDEAHRASGNYAYNFISQTYDGKAIGLTASPGVNQEQIQQIMKNLKLTKLSVKTENDPTVKKYVKKKENKIIKLKLPPDLEEIKKELETVKKTINKELKKRGINIKNTKTELLKNQKEILKRIQQGDITAYEDLKLNNALLKTVHAWELIQTQGVHTLRKYLKKIEQNQKKIKANQLLMQNYHFRKAYTKTMTTTQEHPKYEAITKIVKNSKGKTIIFTQHRTTAEKIKQELEKQGIKSEIFVGQGKGYTQKKQIETIQKFKNNEYNTLIATQVINEGIHVENADTGIFFEPTLSAIQNVQRKGRIGRTNIGQIISLITQNCLDEKQYWIMKHKEKKMNKNLKKISEQTITQQELKNWIKKQ